ncbi:LytR/AlgR family response regulator transcription factor [Teredinibacter franksiae]|uniref:LytR/AlgR family response regulator transcription factor n=1 Tax=Teredinibacter franksiae TaxID=2761453 RepID=UPI00162634D1|nr:LytTR family DNA-binding domain-containing protein [Teredinibacter franksiae]
MNLQLYLKRRWFFEPLFWVVLFTLVCVSNIVVVLLDFDRQGIAISAWEPIAWESSSMLVQLGLIPLIIVLDRFRPLCWQGFPGRLLWHLAFSLIFSVLHVGAMVMLRKLVYWLMASEYHFGHVWLEFFYEYLKDLRAYAAYLSIIYLYRFVLLRLQGEASLVEEGDGELGVAHTTEPQALGERLLVKKLGREFLILTRDIERIEAAGNYANIYINERVYPLRETMSNMTKRLGGAKQFVRVHRSHIINLNVLREIQGQESGDAVAHLQRGDKVPVSRKYRKTLTLATAT